jgi:gluconokinase
VILLVMGVAGAGKSTVGRLAAERLGWPFHDADDHHDAEARARMARGEPLGEAERGPWLDRLAELVRGISAAGGSAVLACSALRAAYRERLASAAGERGLAVVHLRLPPSAALRRVSGRSGHFAPPALVPSQFATLEEPDDALVLDATLPPERLAEEIARAFG